MAYGVRIMRQFILVLTLTATGFFLLPALTAAASTPESLGKFEDWDAYVLEEDGSKVCYMASSPQKDQGNYTRRGEIYALITHRPGEGTRNVFSYMTGYPYKPGSDARLTIDGNRYTLFTQDETAWAPDATIDDKIAASIRAGSSMVVTGTSVRGTLTTDTFSLKGSAAAHDAISNECPEQSTE
jgi:hypothetical protein